MSKGEESLKKATLPCFAAKMDDFNEAQEFTSADVTTKKQTARKLEVD
jgi:hypothetical protein